MDKVTKTDYHQKIIWDKKLKHMVIKLIKEGKMHWKVK
jgi:hypothetical protein